MRLEETLSSIERAECLEELDLKLQAFIEDLGFRAFNFLDVGPTHTDRPYYSGTSGKLWETEYAQNGFVRFDPAVSKARRTNLPFDWKSVRQIREDGRARSKAHEVMDAARDHGCPMARYIFITGGVVSSLGKGMAAAALGALCRRAATRSG
jgi:hypothetical protein